MIGAINLFSIGPGELRQTDVDAAQAMADVAAIAIVQHRAALEAQVVDEQLADALNSRIVIEQAKGIIAERRGRDMEQAFAMLRTHALSHNRRLVDVAQDVVAGALVASRSSVRLRRRPPDDQPRAMQPRRKPTTAEPAWDRARA